MIVIGTWDWPKTISTGIFFCPVCAGPQKYRQRVARPFLTIYFIPVIPIGGLQEFVQCLNCKEKFESAVIGNATPQHQSFERELIQVAALTILEDQYVSDAEIDRSLLAVRLIGQHVVSRQELGIACSTMRTGQLSLQGFLWTAKQRWNRDDRLKVMQLVFLIASAEGQISTARMQSLMKTGGVLELSTSEIENCILQAEQLMLLSRESQ